MSTQKENLLGISILKNCRELLGYWDRQWLTIFDSLYSDLDRLELDETIREESKKEPVEWNATYYISEDEFKTQVQKCLEMVKASDHLP